MPKFLIFLLLLSFQTSLSQQFSYIDSLREALKTASLHQQFDLLNQIGFAYRLSHPDSTIYYCLRAYEIGRELNLPKDLSKPLSFIGLAKAYKGDFKSSFDFHVRAIELAREQKDTIQLAFGYNNFGRLFFDQGDYERAFKNLIEALQLFELKKDNNGLAYVYRSLSHIYKSQGDFEKALDMSLKAHRLRKQMGDPRSLLSALMELGLVYKEMSRPDDANRCFFQADSIARRIRDEISQAEIRLGWAEFLLNINQLTRADSLAKLAYQKIVDIDNARLRPRANLLMGMIHFYFNKLDEAERYLNQVIGIGDDIYLHLKRDAYDYLSRIYKKRGMLAEADRYNTQYFLLKEKLTNVDLTRQIERLQFQLEMEKKESENELLKSSELKNKAIIRAQRVQNIALIVIIALTTMLIVVLWYNNRRQQEAAARLLEKKQQIEEQQKEILRQNVQLEKHITELCALNHEKDTLMNIVAHDLRGPLNRINGLADLIETEGSLNENHHRYLRLIRQSTRSGLDLITDLLDVNALDVNREPKLQAVDLGLVLHESVSSLQQAAHEKKINLQTNLGNIRLYSDSEYIGRIAYNLISNAIKFSPHGSKVEVHSGVMDNRPYFMVRDYGPGFSEEDRKYMYQKFRKLSARPTSGESSNGLGLAIVKILCDRLKATIDLDTAPGKGSRFIIKFPAEAI